MDYRELYPAIAKYLSMEEIANRIDRYYGTGRYKKKLKRIPFCKLEMIYMCRIPENDWHGRILSYRARTLVYSKEGVKVLNGKSTSRDKKLLN